MKTIIRNIKELVGIDYESRLLLKGKEMAELQTIKDAYLIINGNTIEDFGKMSEFSDDMAGEDLESLEMD